MNIDGNRLISTLTTDELLYLIRSSTQPTTKKEEEKPKVTPIDSYSYGIAGLAKLLGCSKTTAWKYKESGIFGDAIKQVGRKIIIDNELALKRWGAKKRRN